MARITQGVLDRIQVLYRQPDTMSLWGIPYSMRSGQSPRDLWERRDETGWVWLGSPGWYGSMTEDEQALVKVFVARYYQYIPNSPGDSDVIPHLLPAEVQQPWCKDKATRQLKNKLLK